MSIGTAMKTRAQAIMPFRIRVCRDRCIRLSSSDLHSQLTSGILEIHFAKNRLWQIDAVNAPAPLRRDFCRSIVEVLVVSLQESIVDFVQLIVEYLLRKLVTVRSGVGAEQDTILIL